MAAPATSAFDNKIFNPEVFEGYIGRLPNPTRTELIKSKAIRPRPDLAKAMADQDGGNYITTSLKGLIDASTAQNYDGTHDLTSHGTETFKHSRVVVGRADGWTENDFSSDITGGEDFLENVAQQVNDYWDEVYQGVLVHILNGVFKMSGGKNGEFVTSHTHDITLVKNSEGKAGYMDATSLNTGMQRACGDNKGKFSLAIMHSTVATNLENLKLLSYLKYTDKNGMERDLTLATLNGRLVLIDDNMPVTTQTVGDLGSVSVYTTYLLGDGAIEYTECGAKVPAEVSRNPQVNGGQDTLWSRRRKCYAPFGISFTQKNMATLSPTDAELEDGTNWELVHSAGNSKYISSKAIPIARILSLG